MANKYNLKLTPQTSKLICEAIEKGYSIAGACGIAEITEPTFYSWIKRGNESKSGKYKQFVCDVELAKAKATQRVEEVILDVIPDSPQDAKWWLTKHRPDIYVDRVETKVDAKVETDVTVNLLEKVKQKRRELNDLNSSKGTDSKSYRTNNKPKD